MSRSVALQPAFRTSYGQKTRTWFDSSGCTPDTPQAFRTQHEATLTCPVLPREGCQTVLTALGEGGAS
jgi:hypothetical protein